jgi:hypothetical protein
MVNQPDIFFNLKKLTSSATRHVSAKKSEEKKVYHILFGQLRRLFFLIIIIIIHSPSLLFSCMYKHSHKLEHDAKQAIFPYI